MAPGRRFVWAILVAQTPSVPPLRDRLDDIPVLVESLYAQLTSGMPPSEIPPVQMTSIRNLMNYHWPGNVRELKNVIHRALMLAHGNCIVFKSPVTEIAPTDVAPHLPEIRGETLSSAVEELTKLMCVEALRRTDGNRAQAARNLGITRGALYRILHRFGIE